MKSDLFKLNWYDGYKALQMFVISAVVVSLGGFILAPGFDIFTADWGQILRSVANVSVVSTFSYLIKNFLTPKE